MKKNNNKIDKTNKKTKHPVRKAAVALVLTAGLLLGATVGAVIYVDPFFHYHAPLSDFP